MEIHTYDDLHIHEETHWWYLGRYRIIESFLRTYCKKAAQVLDVGAGTGYNTFLLGEYAEKVFALEPADAAIKLFKNKNVTIFQSDLVSFTTAERFDLVTLFDVLEHLQDDTLALEKIKNLLSPGGRVLLTVPALPLLWSAHDEVHHHYRRYTKKSLQYLADVAGFTVVRMTYFNFFLFPIIYVVRMIGRLFPNKQSSDFRRLPSGINAFLTWIFGFERHVLKLLDIPFGVSLICVLEKAK
mgnify:CR=1 FL=1